MKKEGGLDRFERMVQRKFPYWRKFLKGDPMIGWGQAADLLRSEHAWMRRMVKGEMVSGETGTEGDIAYNQACLDILKQLEQRRK